MNPLEFMYVYIIGFLTNSVLLRANGDIPNDDILYPIVLLALLITGLVVRIKLNKGE